jgi:pyruvate,water dikinase
MVRLLGARGVCVPSGFATTSHAYWQFVDVNQLADGTISALRKLESAKASLSQTGERFAAPFGR